MPCAKSSKLKSPKSTSDRSSDGFSGTGEPLETRSALLSGCSDLPSTFSSTFSGSGKSAGGVTSCFSVDPFGNFCELIDVVEMLGLEPRFSEDIRGPYAGRCGSPGPNWLGRRGGAGESGLFRGGGGDCEGVECPENLSSHMVPDVELASRSEASSDDSLLHHKVWHSSPILPSGFAAFSD